MSKKRPVLSWEVIICLLSVFLIGAGFSRYLETDSGNILIHDIDVESFEGFFYGARLFRPIQASSMNQRPAILIIPGKAGNRYTGDHIAMEFAKRGFVVLTIEDFSQGTTSARPDFETENMIDAGYNFLTTRTFTDHDRTGLVTFYSGADKTAEAKYFDDFSSVIMVTPDFNGLTNPSPDTTLYLSLYEILPKYQYESAGSSAENVLSFAAVHEGMLVNKSVLSAMLEQFHKDLAIPNDAPLWFDSATQTAQLLVFLRCFCLFLLMTITEGISGQLTYGKGNGILKITAGILIPLALFTLVGEVMNFFLISVRLGTPFNYLPPLRLQAANFSLVKCIQFVSFSMICAISLGKSGKFITADIFSLLGIILCLAGCLWIFFGNRSARELMWFADYRNILCLLTVISVMNSIMLRLAGKTITSRLTCAFVSGIMFYLINSSLPSGLLL